MNAGRRRQFVVGRVRDVRDRCCWQRGCSWYFRDSPEAYTWGPFRVTPATLLWRKATTLWRYSYLGALLALNSASGQTLAPIGITAPQIVTTNGQSTARLGPSGSIYLGGSFGPLATKFYGDTSKNVYYVSRIDATDATGKTVFTTALGAVTLAGMHIDSAGNVFVSGAANSTAFHCLRKT